MNTLGLETTALGFVAGFTGKAIEDGLAHTGNPRRYSIHLPEGNSRINVKVKHGDEREINGQGPVITEEENNELFAKLDHSYKRRYSCIGRKYSKHIAGRHL